MAGFDDIDKGSEKNYITQRNGTAQYNPEIYSGGTASGVPLTGGKWKNRWELKHGPIGRLSASELRNHDFGDLGMSAFESMNMPSNYSYYKQRIQEYESTHNLRGLYAMLKLLISRINARTPNGAQIKENTEPDPWNSEDIDENNNFQIGYNSITGEAYNNDEESKKNLDKAYGKGGRKANTISNSVTHDNKQVGFYVSIIPSERNSDEAKAIKLIMKGGGNWLTALINPSKLKTASNDSIKAQKSVYDKIGLDYNMMQKMLQYSDSVVNSGKTSVDLYKNLGKVWAMAEVLDDYRDDNYKYFKNAVDKQLYRAQQLDKYAIKYAELFMYQNYLEISQKYDMNVVENDPRIIEKKNKAQSVMSSSEAYYGFARLHAMKARSSAAADLARTL